MMMPTTETRVKNNSSSTPSTFTTGGGGVGSGTSKKTVEKELSYPILISERLKKSADEAESFKSECQDLANLAETLLTKLRTAARLSTSSTQPLYDRPLRRIAPECSRAVERGLSLSRRCRHGGGLLRRVVTTTIVGSAEFRKVTALVEGSVADLTWLVEVYKTSLGTTGDDIVLTLPPIASNDPILSWLWSYIAMLIHGGSNPSERIDAANSLANLTRDNDHSQRRLIEEGGVQPLLALLKDTTVVDAQLAACNALINIANCQLGVSVILRELAAPAIIHVLSISPMKLQIRVASLISTMASHDPSAQEGFARENAVRPLITLLSFELLVDEPHVSDTGKQPPTSTHSIIKINREMNASGGSGTDWGSSSSSSLSLERHRKKGMEREKDSPEVKLDLKVTCAEALHMLSSGNVSNCRTITETKGLLSLAKIIELENGVLQHNCLMTLMEICASAEADDDLRRSAFKSNSPAAKLAATQLLRVAQQIDTPSLQIPAIKSVGYLARTFTRKDTHVLPPLISQLSIGNPEVATEAAISLRKFTEPGNFNHVSHSKAVMEFGAVPPLMRMVRSGNEKSQLNGLILASDLAINAGDGESMERSEVLATLEAALRAPLGRNPLLRELVPKAIFQLELYHSGGGNHRNKSDFVLENI